MFVSSKRFEINLKSYFNDKELPKDNNTERFVLSILDRLDSPKGNSAYKFSIMSKKKIVTDSTAANVTPFDAQEYHTKKFYKLINDFLVFTDPSTFIEAQNQLLNIYLESTDLEPESIKEAVFYTTEQITFLSQLKTKWANFLKFNNINIMEL